MSDTPETDKIAHAGLPERAYISEMTHKSRKLERERDEARKERDEANDKLRILSYPAVVAVLGKMARSGHEEAMDAMRENLKVVDRISTERDALRAEVEQLKADKARLDWLETHVVEVRKPALYGSRAYFFAQEVSDEGERYKNNIRDAIDAAMKGEL